MNSGETLCGSCLVSILFRVVISFWTWNVVQVAGMGFFFSFFFFFSFSFCGLSYHLGHATLCREDKWMLINIRYFFRDFFLF
jgi:hypothetical protein